MGAYIPTKVPAAVEREVKEKAGGKCFYCERKFGPKGDKKRGFTNEHLLPRDLGGDHSLINLVGACGSCNSSRKNRHVLEWVAEQEKIPERRKREIVTEVGRRLKAGLSLDDQRGPSLTQIVAGIGGLLLAVGLARR